MEFPLGLYILPVRGLGGAALIIKEDTLSEKIKFMELAWITRTNPALSVVLK